VIPTREPRNGSYLSNHLTSAKHENGPVLAKLQTITFRMHAVPTSIAAICCFAVGYFLSPKNQLSPAGILLFVAAFMLTVTVVAFIKLADDLDSIVATHPKGYGDISRGP
jgi:hypothetical protein